MPQIVDGVRMQTWRNSRDVIICAISVQNGQKCHHPYDSGNAMSYVAEMNVEREAGGEKDEKC